MKYLINVDTALISRRMVVRRFRENDGNALYNLVQSNATILSDTLPEIFAHCKTLDEATVFVRQSIADWLLQKNYHFGLWEKENATLIGYVRIWNVDWYVPKARWSFFLDMNHRQQGLMTEALLSVKEFCFDQLKMEKIYIYTAQDNYGVQRLAKKIGFNREGDLRNDFRKPSGALIDRVLMGMHK